ncbi:MAG: alpha/beta fold hydrolase [bacterium]
MIIDQIIDQVYYRKCEYTAASKNIVYIHGLGESGFCFNTLISDKRLAKFNHYVPDMPGYGKSPSQHKIYNLLDFTEVIKDFIERINLNQLIILGHSMGGVIGQLFAEKYPDLVELFINVEGNISPDDCTLSRSVTGYSAADFLDFGYETMLEKVYKAGVENSELRGYYPSMRFCNPKVYYHNSKELIELSDTEKLAKRMSELKCEKVYILGNPRGTGQRSKDLLDKAGVKWIAVEDAGHWPFLDQPDRFIGIIENIT